LALKEGSLNGNVYV